MTLIECFNRSLVENLAGCLRLKPDKLILLGDEEQMRGPARRYQQILRERGQDTKVTLRSISGCSMAQIAAMLAEIAQTESDCVLDLTGGQEQVVMAVGIMLAAVKEKGRRISVQKYDIQTDTDLDCDGDGQVVSGSSVSLSVRELIALYDGVIHPNTSQPAQSCTPAQLEPLWAEVAAAPKDWNRRMSVLGEFESRSESKTHISLSLDKLRGSIPNFPEKETELRRLLSKLSHRGIIEDRSSETALRYVYTDPIFRYCTQKAGNALEVKTLLEARALREKGKPFFDDCQTGVNIDWDGVVHHPAERIPETRNEIDLILIRGLTPLFISCKNGNISDEELYKLHTVAGRFGGPYARKMLIATDLDRGSHAANRAFSQRAWDMDIFLVTDAAELSREEWAAVLREAMR